jgi:2-polyprenyl-3-methyl-5-hydroxy-6-metoxy-1,4-benzoquinol methylase
LSGTVHGGVEAYSTKAAEYFANARADYVAELPPNIHAKILEVGCGDGGTGVLALSKGKCAFYCGVEIFQAAADKARERITEVLVGDIEKLDLPWDPGTFDALILSEVLEHLIDPWATLRKIRPLMKPGGLVFASSPNVAHHRLVTMLLRGDWSLTDVGVMDRTHLRWFTPKTYAAMFESCGYTVDSLLELSPLSKKARVASALTLGRLRHVFIRQIDLRAHCP